MIDICNIMLTLNPKSKNKKINENENDTTIFNSEKIPLYLQKTGYKI